MPSTGGPVTSSSSTAAAGTASSAGPGMSAWHPSATRTHVVSIHAAQGPPDRSSSIVPELTPPRNSSGRPGSRNGPPSSNSTPQSGTVHHYFIPRPEAGVAVAPTNASSSILSPQTFAVNQIMTVPSNSSSNHGHQYHSTTTTTGTKYMSSGSSSQHGHGLGLGIAPMSAVPVSRNPSANSHQNSPAHAAALQIPTPQYGAIGVPRTLSSGSQHTEVPTPRPPSVVAAPPLASQNSSSQQQHPSPASRASLVPAVSSSASNYASANLVSSSSSHTALQSQHIHQHHQHTTTTSANVTSNHVSASALTTTTLLPTIGSASVHHHENASAQQQQNQATMTRSGSDNPAVYSHSTNHATSTSLHPQNIHLATAAGELPHTPNTPSQYHSSTPMYHSTSSTNRHSTQAQPHMERSTSASHHSPPGHGSGNSPRMAGYDKSTRTHDAGKNADAQLVSSSYFTSSGSKMSQPSSTGATAGSSLIRTSTSASTSSPSGGGPAVPPGFTPPTGQPSRSYTQIPGIPQHQHQQSSPRSQDVAPSTRVPTSGNTSSTANHASTMAAMRMPDQDSPPPLTPSSSPSSVDEVLMTPYSLEAGRVSQAQAQTQQITITMERPEIPKRKGGIFGLFRASSAKSAKDGHEEHEEKGTESRRVSINGPGTGGFTGTGSSSHPQRSDGIKLRSSRQPPPTPTQPSMSDVDVVKMKDRNRIEHSMHRGGGGNGKRTKPIPAPIVIPPAPGSKHPIPIRLFTKRYRTVSSASLEALDGTAVSPPPPTHTPLSINCLYLGC